MALELSRLNVTEGKKERRVKEREKKKKKQERKKKKKRKKGIKKERHQPKSSTAVKVVANPPLTTSFVCFLSCSASLATRLRIPGTDPPRQIARAAAMRWNLRVRLAISSSHRTVTPACRSKH